MHVQNYIYCSVKLNGKWGHSEDAEMWINMPKSEYVQLFVILYIVSQYFYSTQTCQF